MSSRWVRRVQRRLCAHCRPSVRTYGKPRLGHSSSGSFLFDSSPPPRSSSPPSSVYPVTPTRSSSPLIAVIDGESHTDGLSSPSMPYSIPSLVLDHEGVVKAPSADPPKSPLKAPQPLKSSQSILTGFFSAMPKVTVPKKRPLAERTTIPPAAPTTVPKSAQASSSKTTLTQMHLTHLPLLYSCKECSMSYVRGGEDEGTHAKHHAKVVRGIPWDGLGRGKGKAKAKGKGRVDGEEEGWRVVAEHVAFGSGRNEAKGRIIVCDGSWGGAKVRRVTGNWKCKRVTDSSSLISCQLWTLCCLPHPLRSRYWNVARFFCSSRLVRHHV